MLQKTGNKLGYWLFFFLSFHWTNYRVLKTAEFPSSINLSLDYFTAAAYLPVALLLCGSNCCLALRWNASENRFFPIKLSPSKLPLQKPSAALSCPPIAMICHPNNCMLLSQRRKDCWNKSPWIELYRILPNTTDRENRLPRMTLDFFPVWRSAGKFAVTFSKHEIFNVIIESNVTYCLGKEKHLILRLLLSYFFWLAR